MNFLKTFTEFIFEAYRTEHFVEQSTERVDKLAKIEFPQNVMNAIMIGGFNLREIRRQVFDEIKKEFFRIADRVESTDFDSAQGIPAGCFKIKVGRAEGYITMTMRSPKYDLDRATGKPKLDLEGNKVILRYVTYVGEKVYICVNDNRMTTVKVYPFDLTEDKIREDMEEHFLSKSRKISVRIQPVTDANITTFQVNPAGNVYIRGQEKSSAPIAAPAREQQWSVRPGETIKLDIPFAGGFIELPILELANPQVKQEAGGEPTIIWKEDETIKVVVGINKDGRQLKLIKALAPDTQVYLPIGENKSLVRCIITGKLVDKRQQNPVNIKFKALE